MHYLALGDSITYGHCAKSKVDAFPYRVQAALSAGETVTLRLHAKPGWTSQQLLRSLSGSQDGNCDEPGLVTLIVGGNDLIKATLSIVMRRNERIKKAVNRFCGNLNEIVKMVAHPQTTILVGTLYNPFPNWATMEEVAGLVNANIRMLAENENVYLLDLAALFKGSEATHIDGYRRGRFLDVRPIGNPIHPSSRGHQAIADEAVTVYRRSVCSVQQFSHAAPVLSGGSSFRSSGSFA